MGSPTPSPNRRVLRRAPKDPTCDDEKNRSWAGCFETEWYTPTLQPDRKESRYGADIKIHFKPNALVDADKIAFSQTAQSSQADRQDPIDFTDPKADEVSDPDIGPRIRGVGARNYGAKAKDVSLSRMIDPLESAAGTAIDALPANRSPLAGMSDPVKGSELSESVTTKNGTYGFRHGAKGNHEDATMRDYPGLILAKGVDAHQFFQSTALAVAGPQKGVYYGSVHWGWKKGASDDKVSLLPFRLIRDATPSEDFGEARKLWNVSKNTRDEASIPLPTTSEMYTNVKADLMDKPEKGKSLGKLDANTRVELTASGGGSKGWQSVVVVRGALVGKSGWLPEESLSDKPVAAKRGRASK